MEFNGNAAMSYGGLPGDLQVNDNSAGNLIERVVGVGHLNTEDCGLQPNPCKAGFISGWLAYSIWAGAQEGASSYDLSGAANAKEQLMNYHLSARSVEQVGNAYNILKGDIPCGGAVTNTTHFDEYTADVLGTTAGQWVCATTSPGSDARAACEAFWASPSWPKCPETKVPDTTLWGQCKSHMYNCPTTKAYYGDTNSMFMDWWTIFYWAWWITWAPFVGFFVAIISRGRTIREVVIGGFFCPTLFAIIWFSVFGGLAIKMQRIAEIALQVRPEIQYATSTCSEHYSGQTPITPEAKALAAEGYVMLSCMWPKDDQMYYLMKPYTHLTPFLYAVLWVGLLIYFLTSSDSGSMTDDIISASGLAASKIPLWQKVMWCFMEGVTACALVAASNGGALKSLQAASIIIGLPFTFLLCLMVTSTYRALKREVGDEDIIKSNRFNTQLLDMFEGFKPIGGSPCGRGEHLKGIVIGLFVPAASVYKAMFKADENSKITAIFYSVLCQCLWFSWLGLQVGEVDKKEVCYVGWLCMTGVLLIIAFSRGQLRRKCSARLLTLPRSPLPSSGWPRSHAMALLCAQVQRVGLASRRPVRHHVHVPLGVRPDDDAG